jgi:hypothetical protein
MRTRITAGAIAASTAALAMSMMGAPAVSAAPGGADRVSTLTAYNNPNANYLGQATCLINLSSIFDYTPVPNISQCGQTLTFTATPEKRSIPASWPLPWGNSPNQVEITNPDLLYTNGPTTLQISFSSPRRVAGFEATPQLGLIQSFKADYIDASGNLIGTVSRTISGGKARLIAAKTQASTKVSVIQITSNGDIAIGRIRFKP